MKTLADYYEGEKNARITQENTKNTENDKEKSIGELAVKYENLMNQFEAFKNGHDGFSSGMDFEKRKISDNSQLSSEELGEISRDINLTREIEGVKQQERGLWEQLAGEVGKIGKDISLSVVSGIVARIIQMGGAKEAYAAEEESLKPPIEEIMESGDVDMMAKRLNDSEYSLEEDLPNEPDVRELDRGEEINKEEEMTEETFKSIKKFLIDNGVDEDLVAEVLDRNKEMYKSLLKNSGKQEENWHLDIDTTFPKISEPEGEGGVSRGLGIFLRKKW